MRLSLSKTIQFNSTIGRKPSIRERWDLFVLSCCISFNCVYLLNWWIQILLPLELNKNKAYCLQTRENFAESCCQVFKHHSNGVGHVFIQPELQNWDRHPLRTGSARTWATEQGRQRRIHLLTRAWTFISRPVGISKQNQTLFLFCI